MMRQNENIYKLQKSQFENIKYVPEWQRNEWSAYGHISVYRYQRSKDFTKELYIRGANIVSGSDTGMPYNVPGFSLHKEFLELADAGLTPYQILLTTTVNPAKMLGIDDRIGTIEEAKDADLVLLNKNPLLDIKNTNTITGVMVKGRWFSRSSLNKLLKKAEQ